MGPDAGLLTWLPLAARQARLVLRPVRTEAWPTPVVRTGKLIRIPTAPLLELLATGWRPDADADAACSTVNIRSRVPSGHSLLMRT